jgi:hypothetical protein
MHPYARGILCVCIHFRTMWLTISDRRFCKKVMYCLTICKLPHLLSESVPLAWTFDMHLRAHQSSCEDPQFTHVHSKVYDYARALRLSALQDIA